MNESENKAVYNSAFKIKIDIIFLSCTLRYFDNFILHEKMNTG